MHKWEVLLVFSILAGLGQCNYQAFEPVVYEVQTATPYQCHEKQKQDVSDVLDAISECLTEKVFSSCQDIINSCGEDAPSGYYDIMAGNGTTVVSVYCDMNGTSCDDKGGWMRVAWLNMTDPDQTCLGDWDYAVYSDTRVCVKWAGCSINFFYTHGIPFSQVCGMARGYQYGSNDAFNPYYKGGNNGINTDGRYADGIQISYGNNRKHIWAYVVANNANGQDTYSCPCNEGSRSLIPNYVHDYYYCEAASANGWSNIFYDTDVLWDGQNCDFREGPCCSNPKMPWFYRDLGETTTSNIEVKLCADEGAGNERVSMDQMQLFVR